MMDDNSLTSAIYYQFNGRSCKARPSARCTSKHCGELQRPQTEGLMWPRGNQIVDPQLVKVAMERRMAVTVCRHQLYHVYLFLLHLSAEQSMI